VVEPSAAPQENADRRQLLSPTPAQARNPWRFPSDQSPAVPQTEQRESLPEPPVPPPQTLPTSGQPSDPTPVLLATLLFSGLMALALGVWFILMRQFSGAPAHRGGLNLLQLGSQRQTAEQLAWAEATRDAQQQEIDLLREQLDLSRQQLATMVAQPSPTPLPGSTHLDLAPLALILDVPIYEQERSLSCESSAAAMAASFSGVDVTEADILSSLPRHENPNLGFRGNVDGPHGQTDDYGVYAQPISDALQKFGLQVEPLDGGLPEIKNHIRQGRPVIVWITYGNQVQVPQSVTMSDGQTVTLVPFEHTVVVVGYNANGLWVNDPYAGTQDFYPAADFERSFGYLGNMALVVGPPSARQANAP